MAKNLALDLGFVIAYLLPGFVVLASIAQLEPRATALAEYFPIDKGGAVVTLVTALAALSLGMVVSVFRGSILDWTLYVNFRTSLKFLFPHYESIARVEPNYVVLAEHAFALPALVDARIRYLRPSQFYGNMVLALLLLMTLRNPYLAGSDLPLRDLIGAPAEAAALLTTCVALYSAYRRAFYNYVQAVCALNTMHATA